MFDAIAEVQGAGEQSSIMLSGLIARLSSLLSAHGDMMVTYGDGEPVGTVEHIAGFQDPASDLPEDYSPAHVNIGSGRGVSHDR